MPITDCNRVDGNQLQMFESGTGESAPEIPHLDVLDRVPVQATKI
jgi:hypothetical protein